MRIKPKKSLGQNFLVDKNIQRKIVEACALNPKDLVLEIGAGRGDLTRLIAKRVKKVIALEIDRDLCCFLGGILKDCPNCKIINRDILKFNLNKITGKARGLKVIGNIPYYISSPIIEHLFKFRDKIDTIYLTVQKEFALRMAARAGARDYGSFSCFVQYYAAPRLIFNIKKTSFSPQPKVDSSFIELKIRTKPIVKPKDEKLFFQIIRAAFNKRRKTLRNSLKGIVPQENLEEFFKNNNIDSMTRPERLSLAEFESLANTKF